VLVDDETLPLDEEEMFPLDDDDTLPLDEEDTLPLDDDDTLPLDEDDTLPLLPPLADDEVLDTDAPPVLDDDPPVDEVLLTPPLEVEPPLVLDEPPLVLDEPPLEVDEMTMLPPEPPPPKKPPPKPPPPKPPPGPPPPKKPPPLFTGTAVGLPAPPTNGSANPTGTGGALATVTMAGAQAVVRVVTTRRMRGRATAPIWRGTTRLVIVLVWIARFGRSATWTAPPPMIAPPQAHAHNLAKAIRTDILKVSLVADAQTTSDRVHGTRTPCSHKAQNKALSASAHDVIWWSFLQYRDGRGAQYADRAVAGQLSHPGSWRRARSRDSLRPSAGGVTRMHRYARMCLHYRSKRKSARLWSGTRKTIGPFTIWGWLRDAAFRADRPEGEWYGNGNESRRRARYQSCSSQ